MDKKPDGIPPYPEFRRETFDVSTNSPLYRFQIASRNAERRTVKRTELREIQDPVGQGSEN
jgi:hypothetical protein